MPATCPVCTRPTTPAERPFCSPGCRNRDLVAWLDGDYRLPVEPTDDDALGDSPEGWAGSGLDKAGGPD